MDRSQAGPLRSRHGSGSGAFGVSPSAFSYGLGLLLLALSVGLAAALFLRLGQCGRCAQGGMSNHARLHGRREIRVAGPDGALEKQDQLVLGAAWFALPSVKLFAEYIRVDGFAPLNFLSGGSIRTSTATSCRTAPSAMPPLFSLMKTDVFMRKISWASTRPL